MKLAYIADGRSPIALQWMQHFVEAGHDVHLLSTFPCRPALALASLQIVPVAFSGARPARPENRTAGKASAWYGAGGIGFRTALRQWVGPLTVRAAARRLRQALLGIRPDLVHAMRVPFEGMLAAAADPATPLLISVWGNDFTLHASASPGMRRLTRQALQRADGLQADCHRDLRLAERWGLRPDTPSDVIPGNGGVRREHFFPSDGAPDLPGPHPPGWERIPTVGPVILNPRGFRGYVRNDTFFQAIPMVLQKRPEAFFVCPGMAGGRPALRWATRLGVERQVLLLPGLSPAHMGALFRRAQLSVSPSEHDGTPNTLLEAMACGSFPVAGDLESIREWIEPGVNGLVFDPADPRALGKAILHGLSDERLRATAAQVNQRIIAERGTYEAGMAKAERLYRRLTGLE